MPLPSSIEATREPLDPHGELLMLGGSTPPSGTTLTFSMERQLQTEWCWAAVSVSVSRFYDPASAWTQCAVVEAELVRDDCCDDGSSSNCNRPWYLNRALTRTGNLNAWSTGYTGYAALNTEVENGQPLGCRIGWPLGGGHFVILHGYLNKPAGPSNENWVEVADPWYGASSTLYDDFCIKYQGNGRWTHSYTTVS